MSTNQAPIKLNIANQPMTDRELLESAAKAAGYEFDSCEPFEIAHEHKGGTNWNEWNPLVDDGDALRLAVKLGLNIETPRHKGFGSTCGNQTVFRDDAYEQTRRAIVRAAAAIGETYNHSVP